MRSNMSIGPSFKGNFYASIVKSVENSGNHKCTYIEKATNAASDNEIINILDNGNFQKLCEKLKKVSNLVFRIPDDGDILINSSTKAPFGRESRIISILNKKTPLKEGDTRMISYVTDPL